MSDDPNPAVTAARLDSHEEVCAERYKDIQDSFVRLYAKLDKILYGLIAVLVAVVGWLLINGVAWKH